MKKLVKNTKKYIAVKITTNLKQKTIKSIL